MKHLFISLFYMIYQKKYQIMIYLLLSLRNKVKYQNVFTLMKNMIIKNIIIIKYIKLINHWDKEEKE